jgi:hypothetical protein
LGPDPGDPQGFGRGVLKGGPPLAPYYTFLAELTRERGERERDQIMVEAHREEFRASTERGRVRPIEDRDFVVGGEIDTIWWSAR